MVAVASNFTVKLWSFACRHFRSEAAAASKNGSCSGWSKYGLWMAKKQAGTRSKSSIKPSIKWTDEQNRVLDAVRNRKSIFITGSAGTGKTFLLEEIIKELRKIHGESGVYVTASTGLAACALHGQTLHSFAGIGCGELDREGLLERVLLNGRACKRWKEVKALVIDETSMVGAELFDGLAHIVRRLRDDEDGVCDNKAWGGIQLIVSGDFFQLPPVAVKKFGRWKKKKKKKEEGVEKVYAFEADCWSSSFDMQIELTKVFRQFESVLVRLLQRIRKGNVDPNDLKLLMDRCSVSKPDPSAVQLFPRIQDVDKVNREKMEQLNEEIHVYRAHDSGRHIWVRQLEGGIARDRLEICVGARVMLIKNINPASKLVNGATGTVLRFEEGVPFVRFDSGIEMLTEREQWLVKVGDKIVASRKQIPLILAWALSIHKCQGMSLDKLDTDLTRVFGCGMVYVALSRVRTLAGLHLSGLEPSMIMAHPKALEFYRGVSEEQHETTQSREGTFGEEGQALIG